MTELKETVRVQVRFSEVDSIKMVWHGNYIKYLEDAREAFGRKFGLEYTYMFDCGYYAPIVDMHVRYLNPATVDDILIVEISYRPAKGAKLLLDYKITRESDGLPIMEASTIQLFETKDGTFEPSCPAFLEQWKKDHDIE